MSQSCCFFCWIFPNRSTEVLRTLPLYMLCLVHTLPTNVHTHTRTHLKDNPSSLWVSWISFPKVPWALWVQTGVWVWWQLSVLQRQRTELRANLWQQKALFCSMQVVDDAFRSCLQIAQHRIDNGNKWSDTHIAKYNLEFWCEVETWKIMLFKLLWWLTQTIHFR